ncbi:hypothetical protein ACWZHB_04265 [Nocardia sp. FBN12]|uniref:hypothetical protein n=1 Tax=Nocardia sp. FBN12 TaxID=3419766 RepID=UPI003CFCED6D
MNTRKLGAAIVLATAAMLLGSPTALADTGSADPLAFLGPSGSGGGINLGCILESLSGGPATADCNPVQIPTP